MQGFGGFNHNHHSYRIVTEVEKRYPEFPGLNLTWEVLEGIIKHETEYDKSDVQEFNPELRGHLEAQITNVADELAYTSHDLDDGLRAGLILPEMLEGIELWKMAAVRFRKKGGQIDDLMRHQIIRELIGIEVGSMIHDSANRIDASGINTLHDLQLLPYNLIGFEEEMTANNRVLKDFLYQNMYRHYRVMRMQKKAEMVLIALFNAYQQTPAMLPQQFQEQFDEKGKERTICDYLAGMTDRFAVEEYQKLFDPSLLT
jgi:dGTPase